MGLFLFVYLYYFRSNWCSWGFISDQRRAFPITKQQGCPDRHSPGVSVSVNDGKKWGANCYGVRPSKGTEKVLPFNEATWNDPRTKPVYLKKNDTLCGVSKGGYGFGGNLFDAVYKVDIFSKNYLGCYTDTAQRMLPFWAGDNLSHDDCRNRCMDNRFIYFGMQAGFQCFCGNSFGPIVGSLTPYNDFVKKPDYTCNVRDGYGIMMCIF